MGKHVSGPMLVQMANIYACKNEHCLHWQSHQRTRYKFEREPFLFKAHITNNRGPGQWGKVSIYVFTSGAGKEATGATDPQVTMSKRPWLVIRPKQQVEEV